MVKTNDYIIHTTGVLSSINTCIFAIYRSRLLKGYNKRTCRETSSLHVDLATLDVDVASLHSNSLLEFKTRSEFYQNKKIRPCGLLFSFW